MITVFGFSGDFPMKGAIVALSAIFMSFQVLASGSVLINGKEVKNQEDIHTMLAKQLNFPNGYGKNLDALYDTLSTDSSGQAIIKIKSLNILKSKLGNDYVEALIRTISDASADNPKIVLLVE